MGNFFTKGPAAPIIQQVTFTQPQRMTWQDRIRKRNKALSELIKNELLPNIVSVEQLTMICHSWFRQTPSKQTKLSDDVVHIIINHSRFEVLEYELMHKIIEYGKIESAMQWFFDQTNMAMDQVLIVEILASKRKYINWEYISRYLEQPIIDEMTRIKYLKLCGINESLCGIEACFRYFFSNCGLYIPSHETFNYQLLFAALSKTMLLNGNIQNDIHRKVFEDDIAFIPRLLHAMFWSTANSAHYRRLSTNPSNFMQVAMVEKHGVMADIMEIFEQRPLKMEHGLDDIEIPDMVQVTM